MKFLLLGKDGQVGRALAPVLARLGELSAFGHAEADFERPGELPRLVATEAPDVIVNAAAYTAVDKAETEPDRARLVNAEAVALLADAAQRTGAWLIHYSTDYVFDGKSGTPYVEDDPPAPLNVYGATKSRGDLAIGQSGCHHLIFRVGWVYADGTNNFPSTMLRLARERSELRVVGDQVGAPTSARLIADVTGRAAVRLGAAVSAPTSGVYHLAASGAVSRADYARFLVAEARDRGLQLRLGPDGIATCSSADYPTLAARPLNSRLDTSRLRAAFGLDLPDWKNDARRWVENAVEEGI
jgi:dTDP-4-dehydrorhamnose reductase